ncbi:MAG TPA: uroporphyrinogen-III C-methyltransferase [Syntrophomonadaceae bacterium]|nr:uroporphyrinogen-III C-methyltransferase [Syntrophomonadaceae bacterium]
MGNNGIVYLIGAGPGDPGLFTLKGKRLLEQAEVVVYDRLVSDGILSLANPEADMIYVGKVSGKHALSQDEINALLVEKASQGKIVARLKGGDPFLFGRGGEEAQFVREHGFDFEVVPGITSAIAVPAYAGIPVTHRDSTSSFAIITGHEKPDKAESSIQWADIARGIGTLVFLMGVENLPYICRQLLSNGRDPSTPVALIRWGTRPEQEVLSGTLQNIVEKVKANSFQPPAVIVVGEVVALRDELQWVEKKPLWGQRIVVTRARAQASVLAEKIADLGGAVIEFPSIEIKKEKNLNTLHNALRNIDHYNWIVFTSANAVDIFFAEIIKIGMDIRDLKGCEICAIGPATRKELEKRGLQVRFVPEEYRAEGILQGLQSQVLPGQWVLLPRARGARNILPDSLRQWGLHVNEVFLYEAVASGRVSQETLDRVLHGDMDYLTFTSSSTVSNFVKIVGRENIENINQRVRVACIGPVTADTAQSLGFNVPVLASRYTIEGLLEAILEDVQSRTKRGTR